MVDKIVRLARVGPGDAVVEIGPGIGSLTLGLVDAGAEVVAVELDAHLLPVLDEVIGGRGVTVVHGDATTIDWSATLDAVDPDPDRRWSVVANLPYNIATPLVLDLLAEQPRLGTMLVMVQREAGERLAAGPGSRVYGIPSVLAGYWGRAKVVGTVPPQVFLPQPRVESALVSIERHDEPAVGVDIDRFAAVVKAGFGQRRKMLRRSLAALLSADEIEAAGVRPTDRAEQLDVEAWGRLAARLPPRST